LSGLVRRAAGTGGNPGLSAADSGTGEQPLSELVSVTMLDETNSSFLGLLPLPLGEGRGEGSAQQRESTRAAFCQGERVAWLRQGDGHVELFDDHKLSRRGWHSAA